MTFHAVPPTGAYMPPELCQLDELSNYRRGALGVVPLVPLFLLAGGAAAGAEINGWLNNKDWSIGEYNHWMRTMNATLHEWDTLGWKSGCWQANGAKRRQWLSFWALFSKHFAEHGVITRSTIPPWVLDSEELPARDLMRQLRGWGTWLNETCGAQTAGPLPVPAPPKPGAPGETDWNAIVKWGGIGVAALLGLSLVSTARGAFGK